MDFTLEDFTLKKSLCLMMIVLLFGCDDDSGAINEELTPQQKIQQLEDSNQIPSLDRGNSLVGVDDNNNGVRDDIDEYIDFNYPVEEQNVAVRQYARAIQRQLTANKANIIEVKSINVESMNGLVCVYSRFNEENSTKTPALVTREIESITTNTKLRLLEYLEFAKALDGSSWALPEGGTCE